MKPGILRGSGGNVIFDNFETNARGTAILFHPNLITETTTARATPKGEQSKLFSNMVTTNLI